MQHRPWRLGDPPHALAAGSRQESAAHGAMHEEPIRRVVKRPSIAPGEARLPPEGGADQDMNVRNECAHGWSLETHSEKL